MSRKNHNATGRTSLARQGDSAKVCTNGIIGACDFAPIALDGRISHPYNNSEDSLRIERTASRSSTTTNCIKRLLPDPPNRDNLRRQQAFYSIPELAIRWRCSRGTVYNRLRFAGAKVLDFATAGRKGKKLVPALTVFQIESKFLKALP